MHQTLQYKIQCHISLPKNFCIESILAFYNRDPIQLAEHVDFQQKMIRKGFVFCGEAACLSFKFSNTAVVVIFETSTPHKHPMTPETLQQWGQHMLGLLQPVETFEQVYAKHSEIGALVEKQRGLRIWMLATRFEALTWAILSQQISLKAAIAIRRKWIKIVGISYNNQLWCYPDAQSIAKLSFQQLQSIGLTQAKTSAILHVSHAMRANNLFDEQSDYSQLALSKIYTALLNCVGVGPWTAQYTLLRGFGYLDSSLHQDAGVRHALQRLLKLDQKPSPQETQDWLAQFSPWRGLVTAHLWKFLENF